MDASELHVLAILGTKETYDLYKDYAVKLLRVDEAALIAKDIAEYYKTDSTILTIDWDKFLSWMFLVRHPTWPVAKKEIISRIIEGVKATKPDPLVLKTFHDVDYALRISTECDDVIRKNKADGFDNIAKLLQEHTSGSPKAKTIQDYFISDDLDELSKDNAKTEKISWRIGELNMALGPLNHGDFVIVGKRPDTGGTSFLISEFTHMIHHLPEGKDALIINNEEGGARLVERIYCALLNKTREELYADIPKAKAAIAAKLGTRKIKVIHKTNISTYEIDRLLANGNYWLIGINVLEKIVGFSKEDDITRRQRLAEWCRHTASTYGTCFAIMQADASAEGQRWLTQNQLYGSKTGVQGEADVLIMIGKDSDPTLADRRYISICKNKKPHISGMVSSMRYARFECLFDGATARYSSMSVPET